MRKKKYRSAIEYVLNGFEMAGSIRWCEPVDMSPYFTSSLSEMQFSNFNINCENWFGGRQTPSFQTHALTHRKQSNGTMIQLLIHFRIIRWRSSCNLTSAIALKPWFVAAVVLPPSPLVLLLHTNTYARRPVRFECKTREKNNNKKRAFCRDFYLTFFNLAGARALDFVRDEIACICSASTAYEHNSASVHSRSSSSSSFSRTSIHMIGWKWCCCWCLALQQQ